MIELLFGIAFATAIPLGVVIAIGLLVDRPPIRVWVTPVVGLTAGLSVLALVIGRGPIAAILAVPWWFVAACVAGASSLALVHALLTGRVLGEPWRIGATIATGFLAVGATWLVLDRAAVQPFGFDRTIVLLTAVHFHVAGFVLTLAGSLAARPRPGRAIHLAVVALIVGMPSTALGFFGFPVISWLGALLVAVGGIGIGLATVTISRIGADRVARVAFLIGGGTLFVTMPLAAAYTTGTTFGIPSLDIPAMAAIHGGLNVVSFAIPAMIGWARMVRPRVDTQGSNAPGSARPGIRGRARRGVTRRVVIAGGAGHIGRRLAAALVERGDEVIVLSRDPDGATRRGPVAGCLERWSATDPAALAGLIDDADAVVGLTGVPVGPRPWTARRRQAIRASRLGPTRAIVNAIRTLPPARRPRVLVSVSGTDGYEGRDQVPATEGTPSGHGFLGRLCEEWEAAASEAEPLGVRVVIARIGFVLAPDATVMRLFALPFRFFLGGPLGTGRQWFSWIHVDDVVGLLMLAIDDPRAQGPINVVSPEPVREAEVAAAIGAALHRPSWLSMPAVLIRLVMRESSILALGSRRIVPSRAVELGYRFLWSNLSAAMADVHRR